MSWLKNIFKRQPKGFVEIGVTDSSGGSISVPEKSPSELLKLAVQMKKAGEMDDAISLLREAFSLMDAMDAGDVKKVEGWGLDENSLWGVCVSYRIRLPMYLQQAGKVDEAWAEFNALIELVKKKEDPVFLYDSLSAIYDKMRLFLQREKKHDQAIGYGVLSYVCDVSGLYVKSKSKDIDEMQQEIFAGQYCHLTSSDNVISIVQPLLKKAKKHEFSDGLVELVSSNVKKIPSIDLESLNDDVLLCVGADKLAGVVV